MATGLATMPCATSRSVARALGEAALAGGLADRAKPAGATPGAAGTDIGMAFVTNDAVNASLGSSNCTSSLEVSGRVLARRLRRVALRREPLTNDRSSRTIGQRATTDDGRSQNPGHRGM